MSSEAWAQIVITAITTLGSVVSAIFAARARTHAVSARRSASKALEYSLRPPPESAPPESGPR